MMHQRTHFGAQECPPPVLALPGLLYLLRIDIAQPTADSMLSRIRDSAVTVRCFGFSSSNTLYGPRICLVVVEGAKVRPRQW